MGQRNKQHHGSSTGDDREIPGRDVAGSEQAPGSGTVAKAEEAKDVSRPVDQKAHHDRDERQSPRSGKSLGRSARGKAP